MTTLVLIDTSVWLDLAKDYRQQPVIAALEDLTAEGQIRLIIPELVCEEFDRNKERVAADATRSLQSHFSLVRDAITRFGEADSKDVTLAALAETDHAAVIKGGAVKASIQRIETLLRKAQAIRATDAMKVRVTERAIAQRAPYHRQKNNVADAIIIETFAEQLADPDNAESELAFVTHNVKDFSQEVGDQRIHHPDFQDLFVDGRSAYWTSIIDLINSLDQDLLANHHLEFAGFEQPRRLSEILEAEHLLQRQVWYNRHWNRRSLIAEGKFKLVSEEDYSRSPYDPTQILDTIWMGALEAAKRTEEEVGIENLGPWDDFEWGMINGKLSAIRWILGDDWDMLDT